MAEKDGAIIRSVSQVNAGDDFYVRVSDGVIEAVVTNSIEKEYKDGEN